MRGRSFFLINGPMRTGRIKVDIIHIFGYKIGGYFSVHLPGYKRRTTVRNKWTLFVYLDKRVEKKFLTSSKSI